MDCTVLEAIHRIQLQADISVTDFNIEGEHLIFPRTKHLNASYEVQGKNISAPSVISDINCTLPNHEKIKSILQRAKCKLIY